MPSGLFWSCPTRCIPVDCGLPGFSVRGALWARILEHIGQYWLPYPSRALYFLLPYLPTPLSSRCCQNPCDPSSCTTSTPDPHWGRPKSSGQPQEQTPVDNPHAEVEIKPYLKPMDSVANEKDPKLSHQLYMLQVKSTLSTRQALWLWNIWKDIESSHQRKCTSSEMWTLEVRTQRSRTRLESELPPQQVQRSAQCWRASKGGEVACDSQRGKGLWQQLLNKNIYPYVLTCSADSFGFCSFSPLYPPQL